MKTEKRLTMALSVLVALMMLAVPLASSSNLFVDGGQTNSNGDAPVLGASTGYTVTFQLNADGKSLDQVKETDLNDLVNKLNDVANKGANPAVAGATWYLNENGDLCALVMYDESSPVHIQNLINALFDASIPNEIKSKISKGDAYTLTYWKDMASNLSYEYSSSADSAEVKSDMTFAAQWDLKEDAYVKVPINVIVDGETKEYYKAYELGGTNLNQIKIVVADLNEAILDASDLSLEGRIIGGLNAPLYGMVYKDAAVTYGDGNELPEDGTISSKSTITATYEFNDKQFFKLTVSSAAFEDGKDVTLYVDKATSSRITYANLLVAIFCGITWVDEVKDDITTTDKDEFEPEHYEYVYPDDPDYTSCDIKPILYMNSDYLSEDNILTENGYLVTGWNNKTELLNSVNLIPSGTTNVTLDAELNGYYVVFMSKGQFEYVYVPFGELSADLVKTLDLEGVNHWAWIDYTSYHDGTFKTNQTPATDNTINTFTSFTDNTIKTIDDLGKKSIADTPKQPVAVFVACFDLGSKTAYAVFDANNYESGTAKSAAISGNFGNKYIDKIIIPGAISAEGKASIIPIPAVSPVYEEGNVFINYRTYVGSAWTDYVASGDAASKYLEDKDGVSIYSADVVGYKHTVTFYNGSEVNGVFYYNGDPALTDDITEGLKAFTYKGTMYSLSDLKTTPTKPNEPKGQELALYEAQLAKHNAAVKAFNNILFPAKDGYTPAQWKDVDGKVMIDKLEKTTDKEGITTYDYELKFDKIKSDLNLYISFEAKDYKIEYEGNTATLTNTMEQFVDVDETVSLFGDSAFSNDGFKLKEWNTRPDGKGTTYALGASFTLNGEQFKELKENSGGEKVFTLYAIWEKSGSASGSGDNTDGDNGSNTDTYLLAGILIVVIVLILLMVFLMRKRN